jgi:hypothetical protein
MRQPLQQLLAYPCEVMLAHLKLIGCEQQGKHNKHCHECRVCPDRISCIWVNELIREGSEKYTMQKQVSLLEHALDSMMSYAELLEHDVFSCSCSNCKWIQHGFNTYNKLLVNKKNKPNTDH